MYEWLSRSEEGSEESYVDSIGLIDMKHPIFRPSETVIIGPYSHDPRLTGQEATITQLLQPMFGEHRYAALVRGRRKIFLETTLQKVFKAGNWNDCAWQPRREAR